MVEHEGSASIAAHAVEHADECGGGDDDQVGAEGGDDRSAGSDEREEDEGETAADPIAGEGDEQGGESGSGEASSDDEANLRIVVSKRVSGRAIGRTWGTGAVEDVVGGPNSAGLGLWMGFPARKPTEERAREA